LAHYPLCLYMCYCLCDLPCSIFITELKT
jgi:hypothetical protein